MSNSHQQVILFGSPGTGKSFHIVDKLLPGLGIDPEGKNCIRTVFHPEYSYGDFMGKLMPLTKEGSVEYNYYPGHFLKAVAQAYKNILKCEEGEEPSHVALVIDEINRGNSAAIFGTAFQLLDRKPDGWSEYSVRVSEMEFEKLLELIGVTVGSQNIGGRHTTIYNYEGAEYITKDVKGYHRKKPLSDLIEPLNINRNQIRIPSNLSLFATMNTSDNSIYYMDAAFKRRWDWQYFDNSAEPIHNNGIAFENRQEWERFVTKLNKFIKKNHRYVRKVEDRLIGQWFISTENGPFPKEKIQNKVMFFLWDSVFSSNRKPLADLLGVDEAELVTFGDFAGYVDEFQEAISRHK